VVHVVGIYFLMNIVAGCGCCYYYYCDDDDDDMMMFFVVADGILVGFLTELLCWNDDGEENDPPSWFDPIFDIVDLAKDVDVYHDGDDDL